MPSLWSKRLALMAFLASALPISSCVADVSSEEVPDDEGLSAEDGKEDGAVRGTAMRWRRIASAQTIYELPEVKSGAYRVHTIDVGTGLAVLVQGADFNVLYDGGSSDDSSGITASGANNSRLLAYLFAALGPSGDAACTPNADDWEREDRPQLRIDHVFLSHPHEDHVAMLDEVLRCYDVTHVWDSGDNNARSTYSDFLRAVSAEPGVTYHNAAGLRAGQRMRAFGGGTIALPSRVVAMNVDEEVQLGTRASFRILRVDGRTTADENLNSTVLRMELGSVSMLLTGDVESGPRANPSATLGQAEKTLVETHAQDLRADIFQVPHHGSSTSSRMEFLELVQPRIAFIGVGPLPYAGVVLPEANVLAAIKSLASKPVILRTDLNDRSVARCAERGSRVDRVGNDDSRPGGCDNFIIDIAR